MRVIRMNPFISQSAPRPSPHGDNRPHSAGGVKKLDFSTFKKDDWILLGIIATLIIEGSTDYILLCALGYLFIVGLEI